MSLLPPVRATVTEIVSVADRYHPSVSTQNRALPGNSLRDKFIMAITGAFLAFYVVVHLFGNLKIFLGDGHLDSYGEWLRGFGQPLFPRTWILWGFRIVLTAAFAAHVWAAWQIVRRNRMASGGGSRRSHRTSTTVRRYASSTMWMSGLILGLFVVFHLLDLTWGTANPGFERGAVERNVVASLERWPVALVYSLAVLALGLHLVHGTWSMFTSLGFHGRRIDVIRRALATAIPTFLVVGNLAIPIAVLAGWVS